MSLGEDQIFAQQKDTFKHNINCRKQYIFWNFKRRKKILMIGDNHIRRVKRDKLQNSLDNVKSFVRYFSGAKTQDLLHYIIPSLLKEKPETVVIRVG